MGPVGRLIRHQQWPYLHESNDKSACSRATQDSFRSTRACVLQHHFGHLLYHLHPQLGGCGKRGIFQCYSSCNLISRSRDTFRKAFLGKCRAFNGSLRQNRLMCTTWRLQNTSKPSTTTSPSSTTQHALEIPTPTRLCSDIHFPFCQTYQRMSASTTCSDSLVR